MSKLFRGIGLLVILILVFTSLGCGASPRQALYGKWEYVAGDTVHIWEFKEDGTFVMQIDDGTMESTFSFVDDDTFTIAAPDAFGGDDATLDFKVEGDQLTLLSNGNSIIFTRVK